MKILTGSLRGRVIEFKPNPDLRPTSDKARKALFDMLQGEVEGKRVLDLFSGTGAIGMEALSNGAEHVTFVESNRLQAARIQANLAKLNLDTRAQVEYEDALIYLQNASNLTFDYVFLDPPYDKGLADKALNALSKSPIIANGSLIFLECRHRESLKDAPSSLNCIKIKTYGDAQIRIYRKS